MIPQVTIYIDRKSGNWKIERHAIQKKTGFTVATGKVITVLRDRVETDAPSAIKEALQSFSETENPERSEIDALATADRRKFRHQHVMIHVAECEPRKFSVQLMERSEGGWVSDLKRTAICTGNTFLKDIVSTIRRVGRE
jgi:hypothetical protein